MAARAKSIFISYRHEDSLDEVERLHDALTERLGEGTLFRDVLDVGPGTDFTEVFREPLQDCDAVLVAIGRGWLGARLGDRPRLADPNDPVRRELEVALAHPFARVIPVLFRRATMPRADQLPTALRRLADLSAISIGTRDADHARDIERLAAAIERAVDECHARRSHAATQEEQRAAALAGVLRETGAEPADIGKLALAIARGEVVVVSGSELGTVPALGDPVCREAEMASHVALALGIAPPRADERRPLARVYAAALGDGRRDDFGRALWAAAGETTRASGLAPLLALPGLRDHVTSALDRGLEAALTALGRDVMSVHFTPEEPRTLEAVERAPDAVVVVHAAGRARGLLGEAAIDDPEWRRFEQAWRDPRHDPLGALLVDREVLLLGTGVPRGFFAYWIEHALRVGCRRLWVGASVVADDALARFSLRDATAVAKSIVDDAALANLAQLLRDASVAAPAAAAAPTPEPPAAAEAPPPDESPFRGLAAFDESDAGTFLGREQEVRRILRLLQRQRVTVLYSASGMGKSSLIHAGVVPGLRAERRLCATVRCSIEADDVTMRETVLTAVADAARAMGVQLPPARMDEPLWAYFHDRTTAAALSATGWSRLVLVLDQFETWLLAPARAHQQRRPVWQELADLVEGRVPAEVRGALESGPDPIERLELRAPSPVLLISIREDMLPALLMLRREMPDLDGESVRLLGLEVEAAHHIIERVGRGIFTPEAAHALAERLGSTSGGAADPLVGRRVDPAAVQIVCSTLEAVRVARGRQQIDLALLDEVGEHLFDDFVAQCFDRLDPRLRKWAQERLLTPRGERTVLDLDQARAELEEAGLGTQELFHLVQWRLLRLSNSARGTTLELMHDLLAAPLARSRPGPISPKPTLVGRLASALRPGH